MLKHVSKVSGYKRLSRDCWAATDFRETILKCQWNGEREVKLYSHNALVERVFGFVPGLWKLGPCRQLMEISINFEFSDMSLSGLSLYVIVGGCAMWIERCAVLYLVIQDMVVLSCF